MANLKTRILVKFLQLPVFIGILVLWPAGTFDYWQVYVYFGVILIPACIAVAYFLKHDPELLERRLRTREKEQTQKKVIVLMIVLVVTGYVIPGLDRRFGWSDIPVWLVLLADLLVVTGYVFVAYVLRTNSYASRIVEVEDDQRVVSTGPYAIVRHPMYAGVVLMYLATPIALGSWWGLIPFLLLPLLLVPRILNEESVLKQQLVGYAQYCEKVRWRLLPLVW